MEERKQFTFYRSYYEAVAKLSQKARRAVLEAVIAYGLDGTEPAGLTAVESAVFILIRPTLDTGRNRAGSGKIGGSKTKAKYKQTKREIEVEKEKEGEIEDECLRGARDAAECFDVFWQGYPKKVGKKSAWAVWEELQVDESLFARIMEGLEAWKKTRQWHDEGGRFVPFAAKWLRARYFDAPPEAVPQTGAQGYLGQAELEAIEQAMRG